MKTLEEKVETQEEIAKKIFNKLFSLDVNEHIEKKNGLSYLSWAWAWAEVKKLYPTANYTIEPYSFDEKLGYMVFTNVTIAEQNYRMWLPVMDNNNYSMKNEPYEVVTKYGKRQVAAASMFDINKAYMRCLVKNLAMFGLGLYVYAGEDIPEKSFDTPDEEPDSVPSVSSKENVDPKKEIIKNELSEQQKDQILELINGAKSNEELKKLCNNLRELKNKYIFDLNVFSDKIKDKSLEFNNNNI